MTFADGIAQTLTYGLFSAAGSGITLKRYPKPTHSSTIYTQRLWNDQIDLIGGGG